MRTNSCKHCKHQVCGIMHMFTLPHAITQPETKAAIWFIFIIIYFFFYEVAIFFVLHVEDERATVVLSNIIG